MVTADAWVVVSVGGWMGVVPLGSLVQEKSISNKQENKKDRNV